MTSFLAVALGSACLAGCGTYVPQLQDPPGDVAGDQLLVQAIANNVTCEVQNAINDIIRQDQNDVRTGRIPERQTAWLDSWGVQLTLNLTVNERSGVAPVVNLLPPSPADAIFNLAIAANVSADATRIAKMGSYYTVQELIARGPCHPSSRPGGLYLLQSDLRLKEWLLHNVQLQGTGVADFPSKKDGPFKQDVISHQVKFEVVTGGSLTPGWRLTRANINQTGTFLSATRTRTHTLTVTLGPAEVPVAVIIAGRAVSRGRAVPTLAAANAHLASEIGVAVRNNLQP
ncbi:MAG TPA: hypothetical protein VGU24_00445 [Microvirga sp.]|nr:hypothetical protein [Microvirga sp.]